jgi:DNA gyrase/topoisomerase IV subunit B
MKKYTEISVLICTFVARKLTNIVQNGTRIIARKRPLQRFVKAQRSHFFHGVEEVSILIFKDVTAKSRHPLEEGDPCIFNYLKRMDFTRSLTWSAFAGMTLRFFRDFLQWRHQRDKVFLQ